MAPISQHAILQLTGSRLLQLKTLKLEGFGLLLGPSEQSGAAAAAEAAATLVLPRLQELQLKQSIMSLQGFQLLSHAAAGLTSLELDSFRSPCCCSLQRCSSWS